MKIGIAGMIWLVISITQTKSASITKAPDPPTDLTVNVQNGTVAKVNWEPPTVDKQITYRIKLIPLSEQNKTVSDIDISKTTITLRDLTPGAIYEIQVKSIYNDTESQNISVKFLTWQPVVELQQHPLQQPYHKNSEPQVNQV